MFDTILLCTVKRIELSGTKKAKRFDRMKEDLFPLLAKGFVIDRLLRIKRICDGRIKLIYMIRIIECTCRAAISYVINELGASMELCHAREAKGGVNFAPKRNLDSVLLKKMGGEFLFRGLLGAADVANMMGMLNNLRSRSVKD